VLIRGGGGAMSVLGWIALGDDVIGFSVLPDINCARRTCALLPLARFIYSVRDMDDPPEGGGPVRLPDRWVERPRDAATAMCDPPVEAVVILDTAHRNMNKYKTNITIKHINKI